MTWVTRTMMMMTFYRPGQLGDTGIIVLQECGPLKKKGCDCEDKEEEEKIEKTKEVRFYLINDRNPTFNPPFIISHFSNLSFSFLRDQNLVYD